MRLQICLSLVTTNLPGSPPARNITLLSDSRVTSIVTLPLGAISVSKELKKPYLFNGNMMLFSAAAVSNAFLFAKPSLYVALSVGAIF